MQEQFVLTPGGAGVSAAGSSGLVFPETEELFYYVYCETHIVSPFSISWTNFTVCYPIKQLTSLDILQKIAKIGF